MSKLQKAPQAEIDLDDIWWFIAEGANDPGIADNYIDRLSHTIYLLVDSPRMGTACSELLDSLYSFPVDDYILYYYIIDDGIELSRVLRCSREVTDLF